MDDFDSWYAAERPRILATCVALSGDLDVSLDATDEAFTRALERWPRVAVMASPGGWTQTVALNVLRRALRSRRLRRQPSLGVPGDQAPSAFPTRSCGRRSAGFRFGSNRRWCSATSTI